MSDPQSTTTPSTATTTPKQRHDEPKIWQTQARELIVPYLPPPVINAIGQIDAQLEPAVGPEATVTMTSTLLAMYIAVAVVRFLTQRLSGQGRAIAGDDDDNVLSDAKALKGESFDVTVILCGPMGAGKTRLFYHLCTGDKDMPTLTSLKANVGISPRNDERGDVETVRYVDWPGHAPVMDTALDAVWKASPVEKVRILLVLDATQKVAAAASVLYDIWQGAVTSQRHRKVLITCHKKDFPKAKNSKRVKIQMRTELERLITTKKPEWFPPSKEVELNSLPYLELHFCSTTCEGNGLRPIEEYCRQGKLPDEA